MNGKNTVLILSLILLIFSFKRFMDDAVSYEPSVYLNEGSGVRVEQEKKKGIDNLRTINTKDMKRLFIPERERKMPEEGLQVVAPSPPPIEKVPEMVLKGILRHDDGSFTAFIEIDMVVVPLRKGEGIDNISVLDITERRVSIKWKEQKLELSL